MVSAAAADCIMNQHDLLEPPSPECGLCAGHLVSVACQHVDLVVKFAST